MNSIVSSQRFALVNGVAVQLEHHLQEAQVLRPFDTVRVLEPSSYGAPTIYDGLLLAVEEFSTGPVLVVAVISHGFDVPLKIKRYPKTEKVEIQKSAMTFSPITVAAIQKAINAAVVKLESEIADLRAREDWLNRYLDNIAADQAEEITESHEAGE